MAYIDGTAGTNMHTSSYRVKLRRDEFLRLVEIASPDRIYKVKRIFFFALDGFVMYTFECKNEDFINKVIIQGIEFSNQQWAETGK